MLRIFSCTEKNPTALAGFEPANSGTRGQHANHQTTEAVKHRLKTGHFPAPLQLSTSKHLSFRNIILSDNYGLLLTAVALPCLCAVGRRVAYINTIFEPTESDSQQLSDKTMTIRITTAADLSLGINITMCHCWTMSKDSLINMYSTIRGWSHKFSVYQ
jgi:hypothetical protein